jgi:hypothetical protein
VNQARAWSVPLRRPAVSAVVVLLVVVTGCSSAAPRAAAGALDGDWALGIRYDDRSISGGTIRCALQQDREQLTGTCDTVVTVTGEVQGDNVSFTIHAGGNHPWTTTLTGRLDETRTAMTGTFVFADKRGHFTASKRS